MYENLLWLMRQIERERERKRHWYWRLWYSCRDWWVW